MGRPFGIKLGDRFGKLTVAEILNERDRHGNIRMRCRCDCGGERIVTNAEFKYRKGCVACGLASGSKARTKHGAAKRGKQEPLYGAYKAMLSRCVNPKGRTYQWYGGKGITVCEAWQDFATFRTWALANGYKPGMTLDRIDASKGYTPENCQYVSGSENAKRMRAKYQFIPRPDFFGGETQWL